MIRTKLFVIGLVVLAAGRGVPRAGQGPAGPSVNLAGSWTLDIYLSDRSEQVARALQIDTGEVTSETFERGRELSGPTGSGRDGQSGGAARRRPERTPTGQQQINPEDRKILTELTRDIRFPPLTLMISQAESEMTIATGAGAPQTLHTDGKTEKQQLDAGSINRTATWQGPQLVVAYEVGHAGTLTYNYSIAPTTRQLLIRINFERRRGEPGPFEIKLVYARPAAR
jgi:hypothetical protein